MPASLGNEEWAGDIESHGAVAAPGKHAPADERAGWLRWDCSLSVTRNQRLDDIQAVIFGLATRLTAYNFGAAVGRS